MDESPRTLVRWPRVGNRTQWSRWHLVTPTLSDAYGRTGCGIRYRRHGSEHKPYEFPNGDVCRNCLRALGGSVPGVPEP